MEKIFERLRTSEGKVSFYYRPLDGGCGLYLLCAWLLGPNRGEWIVRAVGMLTATILAAGLCWLMGCTGGSLWLLPAAGGLLAAAWRECSGN